MLLVHSRSQRNSTEPPRAADSTFRPPRLASTLPGPSFRPTEAAPGEVVRVRAAGPKATSLNVSYSISGAAPAPLTTPPSGCPRFPRPPAGTRLGFLFFTGLDSSGLPLSLQALWATSTPSMDMLTTLNPGLSSERQAPGRPGVPRWKSNRHLEPTVAERGLWVSAAPARPVRAPIFPILRTAVGSCCPSLNHQRHPQPRPTSSQLRPHRAELRARPISAAVLGDGSRVLSVSTLVHAPDSRTC